MRVRNVRDIPFKDKCDELEMLSRLEGRVSDVFMTNAMQFLVNRNKLDSRKFCEKMEKIGHGRRMSFMFRDVIYKSIDDFKDVLVYMCAEHTQGEEQCKFEEKLITNTLDMYDLYYQLQLAKLDEDLSYDLVQKSFLGVFTNRYERLKALDKEQLKNLGLNELHLDSDKGIKASIYKRLVDLGVLDKKDLNYGESEYTLCELLRLAKENKEDATLENNIRFDVLSHIGYCCIGYMMHLDDFNSNWKEFRDNLLEYYAELLLENLKLFNILSKELEAVN
ncbi:hypothetical protein UT300012_21790 [Paraclostridium bifermentans]